MIPPKTISAGSMTLPKGFQLGIQIPDLNPVVKKIKEKYTV
jgi:hypothetical protein